LFFLLTDSVVDPDTSHSYVLGPPGSGSISQSSGSGSFYQQEKKKP